MNARSRRSWGIASLILAVAAGCGGKAEMVETNGSGGTGAAQDGGSGALGGAGGAAAAGGVAGKDSGAGGVGGIDSGPGGAGHGGSGGATFGTLELDPNSLQFFALPINSMRAAVSGLDPKAHVCATIIWDYSNNGEYFGAHCDDFYLSFPSVVLTPNTDGPCGQWEYAGNTEFVKGTGCVDFSLHGASNIDLVDVDLDINDPSYKKLIASNRSLLSPSPVVFGIKYLTDVPEDVFVQGSDATGLPAWLTVTRNGAPVMLFDRCDIQSCSNPGGVCGAAQETVINITKGTYSGQVYAVWDGKTRMVDPDKNCLYTNPAESGEYVVQFCVGWQVQNSPGGTEVMNPSCYQQTFTYPTDRVVYAMNNGG